MHVGGLIMHSCYFAVLKILQQLLTGYLTCFPAAQRNNSVSETLVISTIVLFKQYQNAVTQQLLRQIAIQLLTPWGSGA